MATNNAVNDASAPFTVSAGNLTVTAGNILLPTTTSTIGQIQINSKLWSHNFGGTNNTFLGEDAGNLTASGANYNTGLGYHCLTGLTSGDRNVCIGWASGKAITTGSYNFGMGYCSLYLATDASDNIAIGDTALATTASGQRNTCVGSGSGYDIATATDNTGIGYYAGYRITTGVGNTCIGSFVGGIAGNITTGSYNVLIGNLSTSTGTGSALTAGDHGNIMISSPGVAGDVHKIRIGTQGTGDAQQNACYIAGIYNTAVGATAGVVLSDSTHQLGGLAGAANTIFVGGTKPSFTATPQCTDLTLTGVLKLPTSTSTVGQIQINSIRWLHSIGDASNTFVGSESGNTSVSGGSANTCVGHRSGFKITNSSYCTLIGNVCGGEITSSSHNTGLGQAALYNFITTGSNNCALGSSALYSLTSGAYNLGIGTINGASGYGGGSALTGTDSSNICIMNVGVAGDNNKIRIGTYGTGNGQQDTAYIAGIVHASNGLITDAGDITSAGNLKIPTTTSTVGQIQINSVLWAHSFGTGNTFLGEGAGNLTLTTANAINNTAIGKTALDAIVGTNANEGSRNVAIGFNSLTGCTSGYRNCACGYYAGETVTTGISNSFFGENSGSSSITTGSYNVFLGGGTGTDYASDESSNILIGYGIVGVATEDNVLKIGKATGTGAGELSKSWISGIRGVTTNVNDAVAVLIDSTGQLGTTSSSLRYKENIADMGDDSESLYKLRPVSFTWKDRQNSSKSYGLIAEEVAEEFPWLAVLDKEGNPETVKYHELPTLLLNEIKKLHKRIEDLEAHIMAGRLK